MDIREQIKELYDKVKDYIDSYELVCRGIIKGIDPNNSTTSFTLPPIYGDTHILYFLWLDATNTDTQRISSYNSVLDHVNKYFNYNKNQIYITYDIKKLRKKLIKKIMDVYKLKPLFNTENYRYREYKFSITHEDFNKLHALFKLQGI